MINLFKDCVCCEECFSFYHHVQLYLFIFNSVPNIPKRVSVNSDFLKDTYDEDELNHWTPARRSISKPEEPGNLG